MGPVDAGEPCEAESLAPLEAFKVELVPFATVNKSVVGAVPSNDGVRKTTTPRPRTTEATAARDTNRPAELIKAPATNTVVTRTEAAPIPWSVFELG